MTTALVLRSRVKGDFQARFWSGGGVGDRPADHNYQPYTQFAYLRARWYDPLCGGRARIAETLMTLKQLSGFSAVSGSGDQRRPLCVGGGAGALINR
jgi:hypothetical protein